MMTCRIGLLLLAMFGVISQASAQPAYKASASYLDHAEFQEFVQRMKSRHGFGDAELKRWFEDISGEQAILDAISRPAESKPWHEYRPIFITDERVQAGVEFWNEHEGTLAQATETFQVDAKIIVAIIGVETFYGRITGNYPVLTALATLAFDYPPRSNFFRRELEQFLLLAREESLDPGATLGSYAGAMGAGQFIPSSYREYAVDFDFDDRRNLWQSWPDAIGSVANYLKRHGWKRNGLVAIPAVSKRTENRPQPLRKSNAAALRAGGFVFSEGISDDRELLLIELQQPDRYEYWIGLHNYAVIMKYNRSPLYAMAVHQLSEKIHRAREVRGD